MTIDVTILRKKINDNYYGTGTPSYVYNSTSKSTYITTTSAVKPHDEKGRLTGLENSLDDHTITHLFEEAFDEVPIVQTFNVYRMAPYPSGGYRRKEVKYDHAESWPTVDGFEIEIHSSEDLVGVIIEFVFIEL